MKNLSELRQDIITGEWVLIATGRAMRPQFFRKKTVADEAPRKGCPFEALLTEAFLVFDKKGEIYHPTQKIISELKKNWFLQVAPNKYPAIRESAICPLPEKQGLYEKMDGVGFHEVVITADHKKSIGLMSGSEATIVLRAYRARFEALKDKECVEYISVFHNHGAEAGASVFHPHSQIIAIPVIPPDVSRSIAGSLNYFERHKKCVHCEIIRFEIAERERVVYENEAFVAFCPYVSRTAFEVRIFPKIHTPEFESSRDADLVSAGDALRAVLRKLYKGLRNPPYNFFIHTAPTSDGMHYGHYHWHIEVIPKTAIWAGFEIGTGIEISTVAPEEAAKFLRKVK